MSEVEVSAPAPVSASEEISAANTAADGDSGGDVVAEALAAVRKAKGEPVAESETASTKAADKPGDKPGEAPKEEVVAAPVEEKKPEPTASAWAKLMDRERKVLAVEQSFKEREAKLIEFEKVARTDKAKALELLGYGDGMEFLKDIAETAGKVSPERSALSEMKRELEALKQEKLKEQQTLSRQREEQETKAAVDRLNNDIVQFLKTDPKFSKGLVSLQGGQQAIYGVMQDHFQRTLSERGEGEVLPYEKAAEMVEKTWEDGLKVFASHPRGREILTEVLSKSSEKPGAASSKQPKPSETPVKVAPRRPSSKEVDPDIDGDKLLEEATSWMKQRSASRRNA